MDKQTSLKIKSLSNLKLKLFSELELLNPLDDWELILILSNKMNKIQKIIKKLENDK